MASGMLMGAGLGAATSLATGNDPLKGAAMGGIAGGIGGNAMTTNPFSSGATGMGGGLGGAAMSNMPAHLAQTGAQQAASNFASQGLMGQMGDMASSAMDGFTDMTGYTGQDLGGMAVNQGMKAMTPEQQNAPNFNVPQASISRPQFQPGMQGGGLVNSNPLMRKRQGLL
tara:strand:- start:1893 stop:2402 length:510 start_codon:yes stop_codon:yes gene_type:complete